MEREKEKNSISIGTKHFPEFCILCIVCLHKACHASYLKITHADTRSLLSYNVSGGLCSALHKISVTVSLRVQKCSAESLKWAEDFLRWKVLFFPNWASKPLMPETRLFPELYFRRIWRPWLGYCTYQKRNCEKEEKYLHLSSSGAPSETVIWLSGWVTDWAPVPPEMSVPCQ